MSAGSVESYEASLASLRGAVQRNLDLAGHYSDLAGRFLDLADDRGADYALNTYLHHSSNIRDLLKLMRVERHQLAELRAAEKAERVTPKATNAEAVP